MKRSSAMKGLAVILLFIVIVIALIACFGLAESLLGQRSENPDGSYTGEAEDRLSIGGIQYKRRTKLERSHFLISN